MRRRRMPRTNGRRGPIRLISTSVAGGNIDVMCRIIAEKLSLRLGQPVVVDNQPGRGDRARHRRGGEGAARRLHLPRHHHELDGRQPRAARQPPYDPVKDFEPVTQISTGNVLLIGPANAPLQGPEGLRRLGEEARAPGELRLDRRRHLAAPVRRDPGEGIRRAAQPRALQGRGAGDQRRDERVPGRRLGEPARRQAARRRRKIQALAITGPKRFVAWPGARDLRRAGLPGFEMPVWGGAYLPAGTPKPIVERLSREIVEVLRTPEVSDKLIAMGQLPIGNTPAEFAENYRRDFPRWEALIKASGAKVE